MLPQRRVNTGQLVKLERHVRYITMASPPDDIKPSLPSSRQSFESNNDVAREPTSEVLQPPEPVYSIFTTWEKRWIVIGSSVIGLFSPLSAQIYLPALTNLADDFKVTASKINLTITTYMIFQGITPMFIGSFADNLGRRPAYIICFVIYIGANIGLALAPSYASLLVLRCLQSAGSSSTVALCLAVTADVVTTAERGHYVPFTMLPVILGPSLGPVIGGVLVEYLGWRAIFWFLAIFASVTLICIIFFYPETCREIVGDGSVVPHQMYWTIPQWFKRVQRKHGFEESNSHAGKPHAFKVPNPLDSLVLLLDKEVGSILTMSAVVFAGFYTVATALPTELEERYGYSDLKTGLMYLPLAGGGLLAGIGMGPIVMKNYVRHCRRLSLPVDKSRQQDLTDFPIERARLEIGIPLLYTASVILVAWGWALHASAHIAVICVLLFLVGTCLTGFNNIINVLLIDVCPGKAATATAANNLTRCLVGAGASAAIVPMINGIGVGWAFTVMAALYVIMSPCLLLLIRKGHTWRREACEKRLNEAILKQEQQQE